MRFDKNSIGIKLWKYFVLLTAVILVMLWLLQTVFLQSFYDRMQMKAVAAAADKISEALEKDDSYTAISDIAYNNSMLIIVTDWDGNILVSVDEYSSSYQSNRNPYHDETVQNWQIGMYRNLPENFYTFLKDLQANETGIISYEYDSNGTNRNLIYGKVVSFSNQRVALYINTPIGAVQSTVGILRTILLLVTGLSLVIGFVPAFLFAGRFAKPISVISEKARQMADGDSDIEFKKGFCSELDELSETLDMTSKHLVKLENARREMLANVTHDLRTPLTLINGYAEKICDLSCNEPEEAQSDASIIKREATRLSLLVNDILDYSALQTGNSKFEFQAFNISSLTKKIAGQFHLICDQNDIIIVQKIAPELFVFADEQRISQVVYNLIANAVVHVGQDKVIEIKVFLVNDFVRVEICDHGTGIPPEYIDHIWDRYFTARERKRSETGTGLGLSIVKEVLEGHKAKYGVISKMKSGSCFWFEIKTLPPHTCRLN